MLICEGYRMFKGTATITPVADLPPFDVTGTWLFKPDTQCWYCQPDKGFARSFPARLVSNFKEV